MEKGNARLLTDEERMNVYIPCESCASSRNMGRMNIGSVECLDCAVKCHLKAQLAKVDKLDRPDRERLRIDIAIRLADFKGLDWNWASTQQSCLMEADKILALFREKK